MMSRIASCFASLRAEQRKALIPYVMAGDPQPTVTVPLLHALVAAGADLLELGLPFSDPMADGPVIAYAAERALAAGTSTSHVFGMVQEFRQTDTKTPIILMGYLNPLEIIGYDRFCEQAAKAGVDGILIVDLPPEEAGLLEKSLQAHQLDPIFLLAPTSTPERIAYVTRAARGGYIYYVSLKGVTGSHTLNTEEVAERVASIQAQTSLPVAVGFGIHDAASAKAVGQVADGVIVGSALVKRFAVDTPEAAQQAATTLLGQMRAALDEC